MTLLQTLKSDQLAARKNRDTISTALLTTLIGESSIIGKNDGNRESTDQEVVAVIKKFIKGIDETIAVSKNFDAIEIAKAEKKILETYLPKQLTFEQIESYCTQFIVHDNPSAKKGDLMKYLKDNFNGEYDGKVASQIIDNLLKNK